MRMLETLKQVSTVDDPVLQKFLDIKDINKFKEQAAQRNG
jgi:hypothetical protein